MNYRLFVSIVSTIFVMFCVSSCKPKEKPLVEKSVKNLYQISVPEHMIPFSRENSDASFEYGDTAQCYFVIVIDDAVKDYYNVYDEYDLEGVYSRDIFGYTEMSLEIMSETYDIYNLSAIEKTEINGLLAVHTDFYATFMAIDVYYSFAVVESENNFYKIIVCVSEVNKSLLLDEISKITASFKEIA